MLREVWLNIGVEKIDIHEDVEGGKREFSCD